MLAICLVVSFIDTFISPLLWSMKLDLKLSPAMHQAILVETSILSSIRILHESLAVDLILSKLTSVLCAILPNENTLTILLIIDEFTLVACRIGKNFFAETISFFILPLSVVYDAIIVVIGSDALYSIMVPITLKHIAIGICISSSTLPIYISLKWNFFPSSQYPSYLPFSDSMTPFPCMVYLFHSPTYVDPSGSLNAGLISILYS